MIIGLIGFINSGKGTVGDLLVKEHGYQKFAFADALKDAVSVIFQWDRYLLEGDTDVSRAFRERVDVWWSHKLGYEVTPRLILQKMGTEACRNVIADNIWIAALESRLANQEKVVVADVRFPNEIDFIHSIGGKIVRVKRGEDPSYEERSKMHVSETAWYNIFPDVTIDNNGTMDDLRHSIETILTHYKKDNTIFHHPV